MKRIVVIFCLMLSFIASQAGTTVESGTGREQTKQILDREIERNIFYPLMSQLDAAATVDVVVRIAEDGTVKVLAAGSSNENAREFVVRQLASISLNKKSVQVGEVFHYRFSFKRQA